MPGLLDILYPWPVISILISHLGVGDLLQLSRVNTQCRAALHGFPLPAAPPAPEPAAPVVRPDIFVGLHRTPYWTALKAIAQMRCSEPNHRKGKQTNLCRYCSMPVCDACIVKESFAQNTSAYRTRTRHLCIDCWATGTPHQGRNFRHPPEMSTSYNFPPGQGDFCRCTAGDGWICARCRRMQCEDVEAQRQRCVGEGCTNAAGVDKERRSVVSGAIYRCPGS